MVILLLLLNISGGIYAQSKKEKDKSYIVFSDNSKMVGLKIKDDVKTNSTVCIILNKNNTVRKEYTSYEVKEYMIGKINFYKAFDLKFSGIDQRRFLYRVAQTDSISIYRLYNDGNDMFFLERDGDLVELKNRKHEQGVREYQYALYQAFPENHWKLREMKNLKLNNHSLAIFGDRVNAGKWKPLNFTTYGVNFTRTGYFSEDASNTSITAFIDHPLSTSNFYVQPILTYQESSGDKGVVVFLNFNYTIPLKYVRPFVGVPLALVSLFTHEGNWFLAPGFNLFLDGWHVGIKIPMGNKTQFYMSQEIWIYGDSSYITNLGFGMGF
ncbi:MAG: hypothetical protein WD578_12885 [Bacteroidales bacterium]